VSRPGRARVLPGTHAAHSDERWRGSSHGQLVAAHSAASFGSWSWPYHTTLRTTLHTTSPALAAVPTPAPRPPSPRPPPPSPGSGRLVSLREAELPAQLEALFRRSLYKLALQVAEAHGADAATRATIHQRWADFLYAKGGGGGACCAVLCCAGMPASALTMRCPTAAAAMLRQCAAMARA
jgi:hypothetical protein